MGIMLTGNSSISQYTRGNMLLWMLMAFQAGLINMGGFMAFHRFVSHVTGFSAFFGKEISEGHYGPALGTLAVPALFLLGAMISGELVDLRMQLNRQPRYYVVFGIIFLLVLSAALGGGLGYFGEFGEPFERGRNYFPLALLCLACGIQNGTVATVSRSVVRTTHLTGVTTDLGIGLVRIFHRKLEHTPLAEEGRANLMRVGIILFFGVGSVAGGFAFARFNYGGFFLPASTAGAMFLITMYYQVVRRRPNPDG